MKKLLLICTTCAAPSLALAEGQIEVLSWGGAYTQSQVDAFNIPFEAETGIKVNMVDVDNPATPLMAQVKANNVTSDLASVGFSDATRLCDEGALIEIDPADLLPAPDGTPAADDFLEGALSDCFVATDVYSTIVAYDESRFPDNPPKTLADFFDVEAFPGKRGLLKEPRFNLEMALMADGVPAAEVYDLLSTPEGLDRAFAKLDTIKDHAIFWEAGAQPPQLLADGEVVMSQAYNGRIFNATVDEGKPFKIIWDGQYMDMDMFAIPKDSPNPEEAMEYLKFATDTQRLADQAKWIAYGPARRSSAALVGLYQDGKTEMAPHMPTNEEAMKTAVMDDPEFWADHDAELTERFNSWLASN